MFKYIFYVFLSLYVVLYSQKIHSPIFLIFKSTAAVDTDLSQKWLLPVLHFYQYAALLIITHTITICGVTIILMKFCYICRLYSKTAKTI